MPRQITLTDPTFSRLQAFAEPFVDSPEDAIKKILDIAEKARNQPTPTRTTPAPPNPAAVSAIDYDPKKAPDLTFTRVVSVEFQGKLVPKGDATWNGLLSTVIIEAHKKLPNFTDLRKVIHVNMVPGSKTDEGYRYLLDADVSVQGQDANAAWQTIYHTATHLQLSVEVVFFWRQKQNAANPGTTGRLKIN
jgi:hypothetical protein